MTFQSFIYISLSSAATSGGLSEPAIDDLANHVAAIIPDKWKQVAIQLRVSMSEIRRISTDEKGSLINSWLFSTTGRVHPQSPILGKY